MKKVLFLFIIGAAFALGFPFKIEIDEYDRKYKGFYADIFFHYGNQEEKDKLGSNEFLYNYGASIFKLGAAAESSLPVVPISIRAAGTWIMQYQNPNYLDVDVLGSNKNDEGNWLVYSNENYYEAEMGFEIELGATLHKHTGKRFEPFVGLNWKYSAIKYASGSISNSSSSNIEPESRDLVSGHGMKFYFGSYLKVWYPWYLRGAAGIELQNYHSHDSPRSIDFTHREIFTEIGVSVKLPYKSRAEHIIETEGDYDEAERENPIRRIINGIKERKKERELEKLEEELEEQRREIEKINRESLDDDKDD